MESSTSYAKLPHVGNAAVTVADWPAEFRIVYMVRNPADRIRSQHLHSLALGWAGQPISKGLLPAALMFSNYQLQLRPYAQLLGQQNIMVVQFEEFRTHPQAVAERVCGFLGLESNIDWKDPGHINSGTFYKCRLLVHMLNQHRVLDEPLNFAQFKDLHYDVAKLIMSKLLAPKGQSHLVEQTDAALVAAFTPSADQVAEIRQILAPDLHQFEQEWNIDPWSDTWRS